MKNSIVALLLVSILALVGAGEPGPDAKDKKARKSNFTIGKYTTYVTGPVDKDGYIDYPAALNERMGRGVTPKTNANVLIWKALGPTPDGGKRMPAKFFNLMGIDEPPERGEYFIDLKKFVRERLKIQDPDSAKKLEEQLSETARCSWSANDYPQIAEWLKANEKPLALIVEASKRSDYFAPAAASSILISRDPVQYPCRELTKALASRALLKASEGKPDEAWQDLLACHRLARLTAKGGDTVGWLNGQSIEQIAQQADLAMLARSMDSAQVQGYLRDLKALPRVPQLADQWDRGERFMFLDQLMMVDRHGLGYMESLSGGDGKNLPEGPLDDFNWDVGLRIANRWYDRIAASMREKDRPAREKLLDQIQTDLKAPKTNLLKSEELGTALLDILKTDKGKELLGVDTTPEARGKVLAEVLIGLLISSFQKHQAAADRLEQGQRNLCLALALAAYECDNKSYPKTLDALAPKYLPKVPDDLFTGKPLVYRPTENGYLLYSFGPDGKDDEGRGTKDEPKGDDIAVRVPVAKPAKK